MFALGPLELGALLALVVFIGGWRSVPRLLQGLQRFRLLRPDLSLRMKSLLRYLSGGR